jgi:pimeloyl-ACP methyl ester carboxylesterase
MGIALSRHRPREPISFAGKRQDAERAVAGIAASGAGDLAYDPGLIRAPVAIVRGEWDSLATDADARWLFDALKASPVKRDVKIGRATHLMHLEENRYALYREAQTFLNDCDRQPALR